MIDADRCLVCGEIIPEGSQVCTACRKKYNIEPPDDLEETAQELRDIADVLKITEVNGKHTADSSQTGKEKQWQEKRINSHSICR